MEREQQILRRAAWAEGLYAYCAAMIALSLSWPLSGALLILWVHWTATAAIAAVLAFWLRRPARGSWHAAAGLSAYVGLITLWLACWLVILAPSLPRLGLRTVLSIVVPPIVGLAQVAVAVACWRSRALRHGLRQGAGPVEIQPILGK